MNKQAETLRADKLKNTLRSWKYGAAFEYTAGAISRETLQVYEIIIDEVIKEIDKQLDREKETDGSVKCCSCGKIIPIGESNRLLFNEGGDPTEAKYFCDDCFEKIVK